VAVTDHGSSGGAAGGRGAPTADDQQRLRIYQAEIAYQIQKNWAFSEQMAGGRTDLEAALGIKIMADGEIEEVWFDQRSGNRLLDDSAYRAVIKSSPLPPLPHGLFKDQYIVGLKFGPKGLKRQ
jgi:colicin import membrane protein